MPSVGLRITNDEFENFVSLSVVRRAAIDHGLAECGRSDECNTLACGTIEDRGRVFMPLGYPILEFDATREGVIEPTKDKTHGFAGTLRTRFLGV
jgi:hypothetical protein